MNPILSLLKKARKRKSGNLKIDFVHERQRDGERKKGILFLAKNIVKIEKKFPYDNYLTDNFAAFKIEVYYQKRLKNPTKFDKIISMIKAREDNLVKFWK